MTGYKSPRHAGCRVINGPYLALPRPPLHAAPARLGALAPARPARPEPEPGVAGAHPLLLNDSCDSLYDSLVTAYLVAVHAGTVARALRDVVHGVVADVPARAVVAD